MSRKESTPELSVIVLTYNQAQYVERALESVLDIDGVDYEVIVSDDGSTDGTRRVLERIAEGNAGRVHLLPEHSNYGIVRNYFYALEHCRGRYVTDVAGDDRRISQGMLRGYIDLLDRTPGAVAVSSRWIHGGKLCGSGGIGQDNRTMMRRMLSLETPPPMMLSAMIYRRSSLLECMACNRGVVCNPVSDVRTCL